MATPFDPNRLTSLERRSALSLASIFALRMLGLFLILPVFAVFAEQLPGGDDPFLVGLTLGIYGLTQGILQIPFGMASDRFGRKPVIIVGLLIFIVGSVISAIGHDIYTVMVGRAIQGAGAISAAVTAMLSDSVRDRVITRAMALIGASIGLTFAFSLVAAPVLATYIGVQGLFWLTAALSFLSIGVIVSTPSPSVSPARADAKHQPWYRIVFDPQLLRLNVGIFILHTAQMALFVVIPVRLSELDLPVINHWYIYLPTVLVSFVVMMPCISRAERAGRLKQLYLIAISLLCCVFVGLHYFDVSLWAITTLLLFFFIGFNILEASLPSLVSKTAPPADKGLALGVFNTTQSIGLFVGGALGGWLSSRYGSSGVYLSGAVLMLLWLTFAFGMANPVRHERGKEIDLN